MRVIRHQSGWDIALDMVFTDKQTADTIAERIQYAVYALLRDAVDTSMCGSKVPGQHGNGMPSDASRINPAEIL